MQRTTERKLSNSSTDKKSISTLHPARERRQPRYEGSSIASIIHGNFLPEIKPVLLPQSVQLHSHHDTTIKQTPSSSSVNGSSNRPVDGTESSPPPQQPKSQGNIVIIEKLRQRLQEVEKDNERFKQHILNLSIEKAKKKTVRDMATQTNSNAKNNLEKDLANMKAHLEETLLKLSSSSHENDLYKEQLYQTNEKLNTLRFLNEKQQENIEALTKENNRKIEEYESVITNLRQENSKVFEVKEHSKQSVGYDVRAVKVKVDSLRQENDAMKGSVQTSLQSLLSHYEQSLKQLSSHLQIQYNIQIEKLSMTVGSEKEKVDKLQEDLNALKSAYRLEKDLHQLSKDKLAASKTAPQPSSNESSSASKKLEEDLRVCLEEMERRGVKLQQSTQLLLAYQEKKQLEIQALKHVAHVKDLGRIANLREVGLEKDKLASELQTSR